MMWMMSLTKKTFLGFAWVTIVMAAALMFTSIYWMVYPYRGLTTKLTPALMVHQQVVQQGSVITYTVSYCVSDNVPLPITINRVLELQKSGTLDDFVSWPVAPAITYVIQQRCETVTRLLGVPMFVPVGTYHIHASYELQVNPIRRIYQTWQSNDFEVQIGTGDVTRRPEKVPNVAK